MCDNCDRYIQVIEHLTKYCRSLEKKVDSLEKSSEKSLLKEIRNHRVAVIDIQNVSIDNFTDVAELIFNIFKR